jgi:hypothetical protein
LVCAWLGVFLEEAAKVLERCTKQMVKRQRAVHEWANPEAYGKAPPRLRKLFYRRKTVERLVRTNESLRRILDKQQGQVRDTASPED